jgi:hypothetical protein
MMTDLNDVHLALGVTAFALELEARANVGHFNDGQSLIQKTLKITKKIY